MEKGKFWNHRLNINCKFSMNKKFKILPCLRPAKTFIRTYLLQGLICIYREGRSYILGGPFPRCYWLFYGYVHALYLTFWLRAYKKRQRREIRSIALWRHDSMLGISYKILYRISNWLGHGCKIKMALVRDCNTDFSYIVYRLWCSLLHFIEFSISIETNSIWIIIVDDMGILLFGYLHESRKAVAYLPAKP